jgi:hypothetical protein
MVRCAERLALKGKAARMKIPRRGGTHQAGIVPGCSIQAERITALVAAAGLMLLTISACAAPRRDVPSGQPRGTAMNVQRAEVVHISILAPRQQVIAFLSDMHNWKTWAAWIRSVSRSSARDWTLETEAGRMQVRFVEQNSLGVLDHQVTLASGVTVLNSMRVLANGSGSELVMVVFQSPGASTEEFERDVQAVRDDLARIKKVAEAMMKETRVGGQDSGLGAVAP